VERRLNRLLIANQRALPLGLREPDIRFDPAGRENRLRDLRRQVPRALRSAEKTRQLRARSSQRAAETQRREIGGSRYADLGVGRDQILLRGSNIRTALQ
jgi:hypothetical protein